MAFGMLKGFWSWRSRKRFCHRMFVEGKLRSYFFQFAVKIGGLLLRPTVHVDVSWNQTSFCRHLHRRCLDVVSCPALPHVKMLPYNLTRQTSFLLPVLLFVALNIILCKLIESEEVGKIFALPEDLKLSDRIKSALNFKWFWTLVWHALLSNQIR